MSKTAHTPGPWIARGRVHPSKHRKFRVWATTNADHAKGGVRPDDFFIADVFDRNDAVLMAAAPDLLEALEAFASHYPMGINPMLDDAAVKAHDAIARAKGGA